MQDLGEDMFLVGQHGDFVHALAQVQVGQVEQLHRGPPVWGWFFISIAEKGGVVD